MIENVCRIPIDLHAHKTRSVVDLLQGSGYFDDPDSLTVDAVNLYLRGNPGLVDAWLMYLVTNARDLVGIYAKSVTGVIVELLLIAGIDYTPWGQRVLGTAGIGWTTWAVAVPFAVALLVLDCLWKRRHARVHRSLLDSGTNTMGRSQNRTMGSPMLDSQAPARDTGVATASNVAAVRSSAGSSGS
jgi:Cation transporting ATPase, C-terminus